MLSIAPYRRLLNNVLREDYKKQGNITGRIAFLLGSIFSNNDVEAEAQCIFVYECCLNIDTI